MKKLYAYKLTGLSVESEIDGIQLFAKKRTIPFVLTIANANEGQFLRLVDVMPYLDTEGDTIAFEHLNETLYRSKAELHFTDSGFHISKEEVFEIIPCSELLLEQDPFN